MTVTVVTAHPLSNGCPPEWASAWGQDRHGPWVSLSVGDAEQRLRWVPPGRFWMGSRNEEPGRFDNEGPRHQVSIEPGFWLFETPCTQALWEAVLGDKPSEFKSPQRPVEQVSWDDCQRFVEQINSMLPLELRLPTEAEWEYACRGGTNLATYAGSLEILGERNAPMLDAIAWYGGNSRVDFELSNGSNASGWTQTQHDFETAGTHPVARKSPNAWGLYDMLGNVYEWCNDGPREYDQAPVLNPIGTTDLSADRVIRGGSWDSDAQDVRAAFRLWSPPSYRLSFFGFRCRVQ